MKNDSSIIAIDYLSLYSKCRNHYPSDFDKIVRYVTELRKKYKNQQNG